jgi:uncharacterized protein YgiM (DUF1202 family)
MTEFEKNEGFTELSFEDMEEVSGGKKVNQEQQIQATGDLNVRTGPGLGYDIIGSIKKGTKLDFTGEVKKDGRGVYWGKVLYKGKTGWVSSKYSKII